MIIKKIAFIIFFLFSTILYLVQPSDAEDSAKFNPSPSTDETTWKTPLEEKGLFLGLSFNNDLQTNHRGGLRQGTTDFASWDLNTLVNTEKAGFWKGGSFFLSLLAIAGREGSEYTGDLQVASNIEGPESIRIFQAWYEHQLVQEKASLLFGLHDLNCDFYSLDYASYLINSSFGIGPEVSQAGISIYPITALGTRLQIRPTETTYLLAGIYDGVPGSPNDTKGTDITLSKEDGAFSIFELGIAEDDPDTETRLFKIASGFWMRSTEFTDYAEENQNFDNGYYLLAEKYLLELGQNWGKLASFAQFGANPGGKNQIGSYFGAGLTLAQPLPSRTEDVFALGIAHAMNSDPYQEYAQAENAETSYELTYLLQLQQSIALQGSLQWIRNPGTDPELRNSFTSIVRLIIDI